MHMDIDSDSYVFEYGTFGSTISQILLQVDCTLSPPLSLKQVDDVDLVLGPVFPLLEPSGPPRGRLSH